MMAADANGVIVMNVEGGDHTSTTMRDRPIQLAVLAVGGR